MLEELIYHSLTPVFFTRDYLHTIWVNEYKFKPLLLSFTTDLCVPHSVG